MPSRRQILGGVGTVFVGGSAGCASQRTTTGAVAHKKVGVEVPRTTGRPVDVTLALLTYEPERQLVTGEYADIVPEVIDGASLSVSDAIRDRLADRFASIRYYANIVPEESSSPVSGLLSRRGFNSLSIGEIATVDPDMKQVEGNHSVSYLRVKELSGRDQQPQNVQVSQYSWDERLDGILAP